MGMVPREKNLGDGMPVPNGRLRILRVFQKALGKGLLLDGTMIPEYAGYKPDGRVDQGLCGDLSAGQDEIAQADLADVETGQHALIQPLEPAADQDRAGPCGQCAGLVTGALVLS